MGSNGWTWAIFFARWVVGLIFFMAGWWKVFSLGALQHAQQMFVVGFADTWIPSWLLWSLGTSVPFVELLAGALVCFGLRTREACIALGVILIIVTYGHLLQEPLFSTTAHIFPRLALVLFVLAAPVKHDAWSVDAWLAHRRSKP